MELEPGTQLGSTCCSTEIIVVRPPSAATELTCGGHPMVLAGDKGAITNAPAEGHDGGTSMGKRYEAPALGLEVLCIVGGGGTLAANGETMHELEAKPLPSTD